MHFEGVIDIQMELITLSPQMLYDTLACHWRRSRLPY